MRWGRFWQLFHSLLARRRASRRKLPNRPVVKSVIGGVIDEQRKIAIVLEIIDATHWRGAWNGQTYECRMFPDTTTLTVGDAVVVHTMPNSTELWCSLPPRGNTVELWFSPGYQTGPPVGNVELWRLTINTDTDAATPELVWTSPNYNEYITHLGWCKVDDKLYVYCYDYDIGADGGVRIYRVDRTAGTLDEIIEQAITVAGPPGSEVENLSPILDSAQYQDKVFTCSSGNDTRGPIVWVFDPVAETFAYVWQDVSAGGEGTGQGVGMATDSGNGRLFASNGTDVYVSSDGVNFALDANLMGSGDGLSMITQWEDDLCYHNLQGSPTDAAIGIRDNVADTWAEDLVIPVPDDALISLTNVYNPATSAIEATYSASWGWFWSYPHDGEIWRKAPGGAWALDGQLDHSGTSGGYPMWGYMLLVSQSLAQANGKLYILGWFWHRLTGPPAITYGEHHNHVHIYRRDAAATYVKVWDSGAEMNFIATWAPATGMALTPGTATPVMMRQHEV